jgi:hypothetical protein
MNRINADRVKNRKTRACGSQRQTAFDFILTILNIPVNLLLTLKPKTLIFTGMYRINTDEI